MEVTINETQRRDQVTIMADLLENMQESRRLTHILYMSNMSYTQLVKYLDTMIESGFIEERKKPFRLFKTTKTGRIFMNLIRGNGIDPKDVVTDALDVKMSNEVNSTDIRV